MGSGSTEDRFVEAIQAMLARPDYLLPLAAAERQFRDHYYGLNSAALLEDLFFDALGNFLRQTSPSVRLTRPPTGQKGWDYSFNGIQISHKVNQSLGDIAALWDATKSGVTEWSFEEPIVYVLGKNAPSTGVKVEGAGIDLSCRSVADLGKPYRLDGRAVLIVDWPASGSQPTLLEVLPSEEGQAATDVLPFASIWNRMAEHVAHGKAANDLDVLVTTRRAEPLLVEELRQLTGRHGLSISVDLRGGVYLLRHELLQRLSVKVNNRAILIPRETVKTLLLEASLRGLFAPLPLWYWPYAQERPPDMYSAQRAEYEGLFSARGVLTTE